MNRFLPLLALFAVLFLSRAEPARGDFGSVVTTYAFAPSKVLADPTRDRVYALVPANNTLQVINTLNTAVATVQLPVDSVPVDMTLSRDNRLLYIANSGSTVHAVSIVGNLDAPMPTYLSSIPLAGPGLGIAAAVDTNTGDDLLFVLTAETLIIPPDPKTPLNPPTTKNITPILVVDGTMGTTVSQVGEDNVVHRLVGTSFDGTSVLVAGSLGLETFSVADGTRTAANPTIGTSAIQLILSNTGSYFCVPDPGGNGGGSPLTTLLFDAVTPPGYYGTFSDQAVPGPVAFAPDDSLVYQLRFSSTGGPELLVFSTTTFVQTTDPAVLPTNDLTLSADGRNTIALDRSGSLLFIGGSTNFQSDSPGELLVVDTGVLVTPVIISPLTASGTEGMPFTYQITTTSTPDSFDAAGLPSGLAIDHATGLISGTPTVAGTFQVLLSAVNAAGTGAATLTLIISEPGMSLVPAINNTSLPDGNLGQFYSAQITATNSPDSFDATGLPPGLTIDPVSGIISGTPTVSANYTVTVTATNVYGTGMALLPLTITANTTPAPVITSPTSASGAVGTPFTYQTTATGNPTVFSASSLPKGLSLDMVTGVISGTPTVIGSSTFVLSATNGGGTGSINLTITITSLPVPVITSAAQGAASTNVPFSYQITANNNPTSFAASGLAPGLTINPANGLISGTPTTAGTFNITLNATNTSGTGTANFLLTVQVSPPTITSAASAIAGVGQAFSFVVTGTNTPTSFVATGLPPGLTINGTTGVISGTPTVAGTYVVNLSVTNAGGTALGTLTLNVAASLTTVDLMATVPRVTAGSGDVGAITVSRTGDVSRKLVVRYVIKGSARNGIDYEELTGKVKIKPGNVSATISIIPKGTLSGQDSVAVKLTLQPDPDRYQIGGSPSAKVVIVPGD